MKSFRKKSQVLTCYLKLHKLKIQLVVQLIRQKVKNFTIRIFYLLVYNYQALINKKVNLIINLTFNIYILLKIKKILLNNLIIVFVSTKPA